MHALRISLFAATATLALGCLPVTSAWSQEEESEEDGIEYLVPAMRGNSFRLEAGKREFDRRLGFSPAFGRLGDDPYYAFRLSYNPAAWLGYEAHIGHNPSESVHALVHALNVVVRWPLPWRLQPYLSAGYGMMMIFPGRVFEADPVTKNQLGAGAGLEFFLRDDIALRTEIRGTSVIGSPPDGQPTETYEYREFTVGMTFFRTLGP